MAGIVIRLLDDSTTRSKISSGARRIPRGSARPLPNTSRRNEIPVTLAERPHPFPSRTRKLSSPAPKILRGQPFGKIGRRRDFCVSGGQRHGLGTVVAPSPGILPRPMADADRAPPVARRRPPRRTRRHLPVPAGRRRPLASADARARASLYGGGRPPVLGRREAAAAVPHRGPHGCATYRRRGRPDERRRPPAARRRVRSDRPDSRTARWSSTAAALADRGARRRRAPDAGQAALVAPMAVAFGAVLVARLLGRRVRLAPARRCRRRRPDPRRSAPRRRRPRRRPTEPPSHPRADRGRAAADRRRGRRPAATPTPPRRPHDLQGQARRHAERDRGRVRDDGRGAPELNDIEDPSRSASGQVLELP